MTVPDLAAYLDELAHRVGRLAPSHRDPHRFFEEREEIREAMRGIAANITQNPRNVR